MKSTYMRTDGLEFWEWDKTGKIFVYGLSGVSDNKTERVVDIINEVISEFKLPLSVLKGDINKKQDLEQLIQQSSVNNEIDFNYLDDEVDRLRRKAKFLPYGLVIVVNNTYSFKKYDDEPAIYGSSTLEGLMVIKSEYIDNATKHEFGHMIGLGSHHDNCVMKYTCTDTEFCEECRSKIKDIWEL